MRRLALVPLFSACTVTAPQLPPGAERFEPPAIYAQWWALTEQCSGRSGNLADVTWYRVRAGNEIPLGDGSWVNGTWEAAGNRIVLAGDSQRFGNFVRHEMLHALLRTGGHPRTEFIARCGGTVACAKRCVTDGGAAPRPEPAALLVTPAALQIGVDVTPGAPSLMVNDGNFMMVITARNTVPNSVIVQLPPSGDAGPSSSFSYRIVGISGTSGYDVRADVPETTRFGPHEVKQFIFDFHIGPGDTRYDLRPGTYRFEGSYGSVWAPNPPTVIVAP
jgi:hypothetical protein